MEWYLWCIVLIVIVFSIMIVIDAADHREGCSTGSAVFLSIFFTPIAGLLYCLNFPPKQKKQE